MHPDDYVELASRTLSKLPLLDLDNFHMLFGMSTEVGELQDIFKKNLAYRKEVDWVNVEEEIGDLLWYIAVMCKINHFSLNAIMEKNIAKLKARYPDKFDEYHALHRDLEQERTILERTQE